MNTAIRLAFYKLFFCKRKRVMNLQEKDYVTQRDNKIRPSTACMATSRKMFYDGNKIKITVPKDMQTEDWFMEILMSAEALEFRDRKYLSLKNYPPYEIHGMYGSFLDERVCGKRMSDFATDLSKTDFIEILDRGQVVMTSGSFPTAPGHAFVVIGYDDDGFYTADPWGDYRTGFENHDGYAVHMSWSDFEIIVKPEKFTKWGHVLL